MTIGGQVGGPLSVTERNLYDAVVQPISNTHTDTITYKSNNCTARLPSRKPLSTAPVTLPRLLTLVCSPANNTRGLPSAAPRVSGRPSSMKEAGVIPLATLCTVSGVDVAPREYGPYAQFVRTECFGLEGQGLAVGMDDAR